MSAYAVGMAFSQRKLRIKSDGIHHQAFLGDEDISNQVANIIFQLQAGGIATAVVTMYVEDIDVTVDPSGGHVQIEEIRIDTKEHADGPS